ncbi:MAG: adenylate/guanylate cyclase domain-containing protein [Betaproteobacteria bacterium]
MARFPAWIVRLSTGGHPRLLSVVALALSVGLIGALLTMLPPMRSLEQTLGLGWLFWLRGPLAPPDEIVMVIINRRVAANIYLPRDPEKFHRCEDLRIGPAPASHVELPALPARWPRCLHAMLVNKLAAAGAATVAFDMLFRTRPPLPGPAGDLNAEQDRLFAASMARSHRVLIAGKLETPADPTAGAEEEAIPISPVILDAALGMAPFPVIHHNGRFDAFMVFTQGGSATPSLASLAMQAYVLDDYPQFRALLARLEPDQAQLLPATADEVRSAGRLQATCLLIRQIFSGSPGLAARMQAALASGELADVDGAARARIEHLIALHTGSGERMLNPMGPPGTIRSHGFDQVLALDAQQASDIFSGKMVFVGYAETSSPEQAEHFPTVFSSADGIAVSGVEIAATAFTNLLRGDSIQPTSVTTWAWITLFAGLICTALCLMLPNPIAFVASGALAVAYGVTASVLFSRQALWLPVLMPMFIAAPMGLATGTFWKYEMARRQRNRIRAAFAQFVPKEVVASLEENAAHIGRTRESLECACVATDAANFTTLGETMSPEQLADFLNVYYEALFRPIPNHGGFVSDVVGDAMLAIWPNRAPDTRRHICEALLEMREAASQFNHSLAGNRLSTRFGVHWGRVVLTTVGAHGHYEYRAVGDTANTATRIQDLNKKLGTRVLISEQALEGVDGFLLREVGNFLLRGKAQPIRAFELIGPLASADASRIELCERFARALALLRHGPSPKAFEAFRNLAADFPDDGPVQFYLGFLSSGNALRDGALRVE